MTHEQTARAILERFKTETLTHDKLVETIAAALDAHDAAQRARIEALEIELRVARATCEVLSAKLKGK